MDKAFDAVFQREIDAEVIAKTSYYMSGNRFRYQCLCCGEEVYLAAADSTIKTPHFRHRRGNNDTDCERYLGQPGAVEHYISLRKNIRERIGFCFNIEFMTFEMSILFTAEEIAEYAMNKNSLSIYTKYCYQPIFSVFINTENFIADNRNYFTLAEYSNDYYISMDSIGNIKTVYTDVIRKDGKLNVYRMEHLSCHYKRILSNILYTHSKYLAISENEDYIEELINLQSIEVDGEAFAFYTQGKQYYAVKFVIQYEDHSSRMFFLNQEFKVEASENMTILWPPVFTRNSGLICTTEKVYISSSFELIPHGNVTSDYIDIQNLCNRVCQLTFKNKVEIYEKNVESSIIKEENITNEINYEEPELVYVDKYSIPNTYDFYLLDHRGCSKLMAGSTIYISNADRIIGYKNGHIKVIIMANPVDIPDKKMLLDNIIKYHPQLEPFEPDDFMDVEVDEIIMPYIEECYRSGNINTVIKKYIREGWI